MIGDAFGETLAAAQAGDVHAGALIYRSTHPLLLRYLQATVREQAEDVASETWSRAVVHLANFTGGERELRAWLVTIARNVITDQARKRARRGFEMLDDGSGLDQPDHVTPESVIEDHDATRRALDLVATLPPEVAQMVLLRVVVGLEVDEVARIVHKRPGTVRVAVHRALQRLATDLVAVVDVTGA
ncbi:MAG: RNA polymerase sigma factor [Actinomycetes bacterium]